MESEFKYDSPVEITKLLTEHGLAMSKRFGQNFLLSSHARERIIESCELKQDDRVWEIGPGIGALTSGLLHRSVKLVAFEIDRGFISILKGFFGDDPSFSLVEGDVLKTIVPCSRQQGIPDTVVGNLPYNIGSQCIATLIEQGIGPALMVFTLQKEVVMRITATAGSPQYSAFSVLCAIEYESNHLFDISRNSFYPVPDVTSAVVRMRRREVPLIDARQKAGFLKLVHALFLSRRKTAVNNLTRNAGVSKSRAHEVFESCGFDTNIRAERLSVKELVRLYEQLQSDS